MRFLAILAIVCCLSASCAGRLPSTHRAESVIHHFFKHYAKRYPQTAFGKGVTKVELIDQKEIRKHRVVAEAFITLQDGDLRKISATLEKKSFGWKFISWENPSGS